MAPVPSKRLATMCFVVGLGVVSGAIYANEDEKTLADDPTKFEQEFGCPPDYPNVIEIVDGVSKIDLNRDGIICGNGIKGDFVDNDFVPNDDDVRLKATGHGNFISIEKLIDKSKEEDPSKFQDISFSFHGIERGDDGAAKGQFEYRDQTGTGNELRVHGDVLCLAINPKSRIATFLGRITLTSDGGLLVNTYVGWQAQDNGEGAEFAPDRVSRIFPLTKGQKPSCMERFKPTYSMNPIVGGNVQVHF